MGGILKMPLYVAEIPRRSGYNDAFESQNCRSAMQRCFSFNLSAIVTEGYAQVANNSTVVIAWLISCVSANSHNRRQICRTVSKQYWHWFFSRLSLLAHSKKKKLLWTQWLLSSPQPSTNIVPERANRPAPYRFANSHNPLIIGGKLC